MSKNYTQLNYEPRYQIEALLKACLKNKEIALHEGVCPSTISRELKHNTANRGRTSGEYLVANAIRKTAKRHREKNKRIKFTKQMKQTVSSYLKKEHWSTKFIANCAAYVSVSCEWICQWIWYCKHTN